MQSRMNTARHADGKSEQVDYRVAFVLFRVSDDDGEVIFQHREALRFRNADSIKGRKTCRMVTNSRSVGVAGGESIR